MRYTLEPNGQLRIADENDSSVNNQGLQVQNKTISINYIKLFSILGIIVILSGILIAILPWTVWQWLIGIIVSLISTFITFIVIDEDDEDAYCSNFIFNGVISIVSIIMLCRFGSNFTVILQCIMIATSIEIIIMYIKMIIEYETNLISLISAPIILILNIILLVCRFKFF